MVNRLREIEALGQAIWIDNLNRQLLDDGTLRSLIDDDGLSGVTSNPTIFEKGIGQSERYDDALREAAGDSDDPQAIFERLAYADVRDAAELLQPVFEQTGGRDGYVSFELPASLAFDAEGSIEAATHHRDAIDRPNVLIKAPGTEPGVRAFEELTARGVNVNVTLLFAVERYREIAEAFLRGLERRLEAGEPIDRSASVASFFVSRVDTKVDKMLEEKGRADLRGRAAVANAKLADAAFREIFAGARWERLAAAGANVQRPLWGSTSTKNPDYPDTLYVDELIGPDTVNTMPDATIEAARDHATPERTVDRDVDAARELMGELEAAGVDLGDIVLRQLVDEGVQAFADSYDSPRSARAQGRRVRSRALGEHRDRSGHIRVARGRPVLRPFGEATGCLVPNVRYECRAERQRAARRQSAARRPSTASNQGGHGANCASTVHSGGRPRCHGASAQYRGRDARPH
ncbi:MAG: transaldolase [Thermoleophilaceae bacterium]|nr:transaldolase [Thermoleophilaceae bacterium]